MPPPRSRWLGLALLLLLAQLAREARALPSPFLDHFLASASLSANFSSSALLHVSSVSCAQFRASALEFSDLDSPPTFASDMVLSGLGMTCSLEVAWGRQSAGEESKRIDVELQVSDASLHFRVRFAGPHARALPSNVTVEECSSNFVLDPTRVAIHGLEPLPSWMATQVVRHLAEYVGPYVIDPLLCGELALATHAASLFLTALHLEQKLLPSELPRLRRLERQVRPSSANSSLALSPYPDSLAVQLATGLVSDLLGVRARRPVAAAKAHPLVVNQVVDLRLGGPKIVVDFTDDAGQGWVLGHVSLAHVDVSLILSSMELDGLDTFRALQVRAASRLTLNATVALQGPFLATANIQLAMPGAPAVGMALTLSLAEIFVSADVLLALDTHDLWAANTAHLLPCIAEAIAGLGVPRLVVEGTAARPLLVPARGELDPLAEVADGFLRAFVFGPAARGLPGFVKGEPGEKFSTLARALAWLPPNALAGWVRAAAKSSCPAPRRPVGPFPEDGFSKIGESRVVAGLGSLVNDFLGLDYPDFSVNRVVEIALDVVSRHFDHRKHAPAPPAGFLRLPGELRLAVPLAEHFDSFSPNASFSLELGKVTVGRLDMLRAVELLVQNRSLGPFALHNAVELNGAVDVDFTLRLEFREMMKRRGSVVDEFQVRAQLATKTALALGLDLAMRVNLAALRNGSMALGDLASPCLAALLSPVGPAQLLDLMANLGGARVAVTCAHPCDSPGGPAVAAALSAASPDAFLARALPRLAAVLAGRDASYFGGFNVTKGLERMVRDARAQCLGEPGPEPRTRPAKPRWIPPMRWVMGIAAALQSLGFAGLLLHVRDRHRRSRRASSARVEALALQVSQAEDPVSAAASALPLLAGQDGDDGGGAARDAGADAGADAAPALSPSLPHLDASPLAQLLQASPGRGHVSALLSLAATPTRDRLYLLGCDKPLISHPSLPRALRLGVALALVANFALFVFGTFFAMASIEILGRFLGEDLLAARMIRLSLDACIDMMVEGRAELFAVFVGGLSGVLPWMRTAGLLFAWCAPCSVLEPRRRGEWLRRLDALGRWVLPQFFLLVFFQATMNVQLRAQAALEIDIETVPQAGLFVFLAASVLSLLVGHVIVSCHDRVVAADDALLSFSYSSEVAEQEVSSFPSDEGRGGARLLRLKRACAVVWLGLLVASLAVDVVEVELMGFSGFEVQVATGRKTTRTSLGGLAGLLVSSDAFGAVNKLGLVFMVLTFVVLVVLAPLLECAVFCYLAMHPEPSASLDVVRRVLRASASIDVAFCTLVVVALQVRTFFDRVAGELDYLPLALADWLARFGASKSEAATFGVQAKILPAGAAVVVLGLLFGAATRGLVNDGRLGAGELCGAKFARAE